MKVYLAGGLKTKWQERVIEACRDLDLEFFNPDEFELQNRPLHEIADYEMEWIYCHAEVMFAYLEKDNLGAMGMFVEMGAAVQKGIPIIFVDERQDPHSHWVGSLCDFHTQTFELGIERLRRMVENERTFG